MPETVWLRSSVPCSATPSSTGDVPEVPPATWKEPPASCTVPPWIVPPRSSTAPNGPGCSARVCPAFPRVPSTSTTPPPAVTSERSAPVPTAPSSSSVPPAASARVPELVPSVVPAAICSRAPGATWMLPLFTKLPPAMRARPLTAMVAWAPIASAPPLAAPSVAATVALPRLITALSSVSPSAAMSDWPAPVSRMRPGPVPLAFRNWLAPISLSCSPVPERSSVPSTVTEFSPAEKLPAWTASVPPACATVPPVSMPPSRRVPALSVTALDTARPPLPTRSVAPVAPISTEPMDQGLVAATVAVKGPATPNVALSALLVVPASPGTMPPAQFAATDQSPLALFAQLAFVAATDAALFVERVRAEGEHGRVSARLMQRFRFREQRALLRDTLPSPRGAGRQVMTQNVPGQFAEHDLLIVKAISVKIRDTVVNS